MEFLFLFKALKAYILVHINSLFSIWASHKPKRECRELHGKKIAVDRASNFIMLLGLTNISWPSIIHKNVWVDVTRLPKQCCEVKQAFHSVYFYSRVPAKQWDKKYQPVMWRSPAGPLFLKHLLALGLYEFLVTTGHWANGYFCPLSNLKHALEVHGFVKWPEMFLKVWLMVYFSPE